MMKIRAILVTILILTGCVGGCLGITESSDDEEFENWFWDALDIISEDLDNLKNSMKNLNYETMEYYADALEDHCKQYLLDIETFEVSSDWKPCQEEFRKCLEDLDKAAYYTKQAAKEEDADYLDLANHYLDTSMNHFDQCVALMP